MHVDAEDIRPKPTWIQRLLCAECFKDEPQPEAKEADAEETDGADVKPDGVEALLAIANDTVEDERERGRALDTKCGTLVGFTGLVLAITGAITPTLVKHHLGRVGEPVADAAFVIAVASLLAATLLALEGVLMPQRYRSLGRRQLAAFARRSVQTHDAMWVHQSMLGALRDILAQDRPVNDCKAKLTKLVARCLAVGFLGVAVDALIIGIQRF